MRGPRLCICGSGLIAESLYDARGIYCCMTCPKCEAKKRAQYRPDVFTDADYWHDEPIEEEG